jgi:CPA1 family monovalent cation:H+ antiporter
LPEELASARAEMATAALAVLDLKTGPAADHWRYVLTNAANAAPEPADGWRALGLAAIRRQRETLEELRAQQRIGADAFLTVQEELDFEEVALVGDEERQIEEG